MNTQFARSKHWQKSEVLRMVFYFGVVDQVDYPDAVDKVDGEDLENHPASGGMQP